jgi:glycosyltransferase involved in cell wall biosynthesis
MVHARQSPDPAGRRRVLHIITMLELGGAQRNTLDTVHLLDRARFDVGLACADQGELFGEAAEIADLRLIALRHLRRDIRPLRDTRALFELRTAIRTFAPEIVHTHSSKAGILGRVAAHLEQVPIVIHSIHGFGFGPHQPRFVQQALLALERKVAGWTDHFVAVAAENLETGVTLGLFPRNKASVIRSGIDLAEFRGHAGGERARAELGIPASAPFVLQVACFKPQKAPERFVELAGRLAGRVPNAHFVLVGDGALRSKLEALRATTGLGGRLHFPGWRRDIPSLLDAATVVTLTSRFEGLPRALVEALAASVPVVAMAVDGVVEVVRDGVNGFLVRPGDVDQLANRVETILSDPALRARLSQHADQGLEAFDRELMVRQQVELYSELMRSRAGHLSAAGVRTASNG